MSSSKRKPGDPWTNPYRGMTLHVGGENRIWWHPYRGHGRLYMKDAPTDLIEALERVKPTGAQFRVTEKNDVLAKIKDQNEGSYDPVWVGRLETSTSLIVEADSEDSHPISDRTVDLEPSGLSPGDLWPSIYDGTRFSMTDQDTVWWEDPGTNYRYTLEKGIPQGILDEIVLRKPAGGSFRVTPWGDVITLVETVPRPKQLANQFDELPIPIRQIIRIRKERGINMLPVYLGSFDPTDIEMNVPAMLDEDLAAEQDEQVRAWIESLGPSSTSTGSSENPGGTTESRNKDRSFDDDPEEWAIETLEDEEQETEGWNDGGGRQ